MRLPAPFIRLPLKFDVQRLQAELAMLGAASWVKHPNEIAGNSSVRLISVGGGENDEVNGAMLPTAQLRGSPYVRQVLASFGVVWGRSRLMKLAPGAEVPQHSDINYHWFSRVRLHIPIITWPEVRFYCGEEDVHMAAGEAWLFDNWRPHRVVNPTAEERIHLVADTSGTASFWQFALQSRNAGLTDRQHRFDPAMGAQPLTERTSLRPVMSPAEIEYLIMDLRADLAMRPDVAEQPGQVAHYHALLEGFCKDWRQLYLLHGEEASGWEEFLRLRDSLRSVSRDIASTMITASNRVAAHTVLEGRVLRSALSLPIADTGKSVSPNPRRSVVERPIFIVAAPRSGSTLLFETLAASEQLYTLGGEAHWLVENIAALQPGAPGVDSNRLDATHCSAQIREAILAEIATQLRDSKGELVRPGATVRFLEKTPKNALRIPFFNTLFPDAFFIFLWRDPQENVSSIMEAWRSGKMKTYNGLHGFDGSWSLLLPPGWERLRGRPLEEIAAFQWEVTNRTVLDDLATLPRQRWIGLNYADFVSNPEKTICNLCHFVGIELDGPLSHRISTPLPLSRYTLTPPAPDKWRSNEAAIRGVLRSVDATWKRLKALT